jgi:ABC-type branched-subunit amino acid transport system ATPase component
VNEPIFSVRNLTMRFGGLTAVDGVSFELYPDQILAVIGPNGAGKTTVFNVVTGLYTPTAGEIRFQGRTLNGMAPHVIARLGIKRTFQQSRLFENLTVLDNVLAGMAATARHPFAKAVLRRDLLARELAREIEVALDLLGSFSAELRQQCLKRAGDLTPGDRRKLEICRALASNPVVLLLDEPAAGMDPSETAELMDDILRVRTLKRGIGIVLIEHDMSVVRKTADAVVVLSYGKIIAAGTFADVSADPRVQEAYLGSSL